jgi:GNAT superfamily N-acetyltransferase
MSATPAGVAPNVKPLRLPDGTTMRVRAMEAYDIDRLRRLFYRLSPQTVYLRFFQPIHAPREEMLRFLAGVDHERRQALVALDDDGEIVGVARYDRRRDDPSRAEVAVLVEDAWQSHGLGSRLLRRLAIEAGEHGITTLTAAVLGENRRMLHVLHALSPDAHAHLESGEFEVEVPLVSPGPDEPRPALAG